MKLVKRIEVRLHRDSEGVKGCPFKRETDPESCTGGWDLPRCDLRLGPPDSNGWCGWCIWGIPISKPGRPTIRQPGEQCPLEEYGTVEFTYVLVTP